MEYFNGKWGTVCNKKFTDNSGLVACRQMGYDSGKMEGGFEEFGKCQDFKGEDYCGKKEDFITLSQAKCEGSEMNLNECGGSTIPGECTHDADVIITCKGDAGDPTGESQKNSNSKIGPPLLGKLPLIPVINAECDTKEDEKIFRGDPGSIFLVNCPEKCSSSKGTLWGTAIYTTDSAICRAAIHAGVIQDNGGLVELVKMPGLT